MILQNWSIPKRLKKIFIFLILLSGLANSAFALDDAIIAVVNDELITLKDLRDYIQSSYVSLVAEGQSDEKIKAVMKDMEINGIKNLVEDKLILSKANTLGLQINDKLVKERLETLKSQYPSEKAFLDALVKHGVTLSDVKKKILDQLKIKYVVEHEVRSKIYVHPQEVTEFYKTDSEKFRKNERANLESIYIACKDDPEKARQKAGEALHLVNTEEKDFAETARKFSDTPSIGIVERGSLIPEIEEQIFKLNEGEISGLIETDTGIYIFKLLGKVPSQIAPLKDVKDAIYNFLFDQKFNQKLAAWINDLKKNAYIEIK